MYTKEKTGQISDGRYIQWNTMQVRKRIQSSLVSKGNALQETAVRDFPGSPVVVTPRFHRRGHRVPSSVRQLESCKPHGVAKKRERNSIKLKRSLHPLNVGCDSDFLGCKGREKGTCLPHAQEFGGGGGGGGRAPWVRLGGHLKRWQLCAISESLCDDQGPRAQ